MTVGSAGTRSFRYVPLDESMYKLNDEEISFFKSQTGIGDDPKLRRHILEVQEEAYAIHPYPCIHRFVFTQLKISKLPAYTNVLKLGVDRPDVVLLDLGCCFGNDTRKIIADGFPQENVIASDLRAEFWMLGHKLFNSSPETFKVPFLAGDLFDPDFLSHDSSPAPTSRNALPRAPPLSMLTSLTPLQHHVSVIHASALFHLFPHSKQQLLARLLGTLLSPLPHSLILGSQMGLPDEEEASIEMDWDGHGTTLYGYRPGEWRDLWVGEGGVFKPEDITFTTDTTNVEREDMIQTGGDPFYKLISWSVIRAQ